MKRVWISTAVVLLVAGVGIYWGRDSFVRQALAPTPLHSPTASVEIVAEGLEIPWEVVWLPNGELLVTERPGRLLKIGPNKTVIEISGVAHVGEGGLQGMALHPQFADNHWAYLYLTTRSGEGLINRVERYRLDGVQLVEKTTIIDNIPGAPFHDGGRIAFDDKGFLYITTGDAGQPNLAQTTSSLAGKILRVHDNGTIPADNPFGNAVYSYGHRNPQGLAWDAAGQLWATEHGRSGVQSGLDEINRIVKGANYGWPVIEGDQTGTAMHAPAVHSGASVTWAPAGAAILGDRLYFGGLRGESLYSVRLSDDGSVGEVQARFHQEFGRLRAVQVGPDGWLYVTTSNRDGRGHVRAGDDKIIRVNPLAH